MSGAPMLLFVSLLQLLLLLPTVVLGSTLGALWCFSPNTDPFAATDAGKAKLEALGPVTLLVEDGSSVDEERTCVTFTFDFPAETFTYTYKKGDTDGTGSGTVELTTEDSGSFLELTGLDGDVLGANSAGKVKAHIMKLDDSELVLLSCRSFFFIHYDFLYVFSSAYQSKDLIGTCAAATVKEAFKRNPGVKDDSNCA